MDRKAKWLTWIFMAVFCVVFLGVGTVEKGIASENFVVGSLLAISAVAVLVIISIIARHHQNY